MTILTAPPSPSFTTGPAADLFSSYVVTAAVSASVQLGLLDQLRDCGTVDIEAAAGDHLDVGVVRRLLTTIAWAGIVEVDGDKVSQGPRFAEVYDARGYFYWLVK